MKEWAKILALAAAVLLLGRIHGKEKKRLNRGWAGYGFWLLGLGNEEKKREGYLDELRFLAVLLVILVHSMEGAAAGIPSAAADRTGTAMEVSRNLLTGLAGMGLCCNLLFVMISGALLLPYREESVGTFYRKRFSRVLIPLVLYYLFYLRRSGLFSFTPLSVLNGLKTVVSGPVELVPHFWLVYVIAGLYIGAPFLRYLFRSLPDPVLEVMAAVIFLGSLLKTLFYAAGIGFAFDSFLFSWTGIFILGYFLGHPCSRKYRKWIQAGGILSAAAIFALFCLREDAAAVAANDSPLMILTASAVFVRFKTGEERGGGKPGAVKRIVGRYSYSVLLIHWYMLFVVVQNHLGINPSAWPGLLIWAGVLVQTAAALALSLLFAVIFDQTAGTAVLWLWEKVIALLSRCAPHPTR